MKVISIYIAVFTAIALLPIKADAKVPFNPDFCDLVWNASFFGEIDGEFIELDDLLGDINRFKWNVNYITSSFNHN